MKIFIKIVTMVIAAFVALILLMAVTPDSYYDGGLGDLFMGAFAVWGFCASVHNLFFNKFRELCSKQPYKCLGALSISIPFVSFLGMFNAIFFFWLYLTVGFWISSIVAIGCQVLIHVITKMFTQSLASKIEKEDKELQEKNFPEANFIDGDLLVLEGKQIAFDAEYRNGVYHSAFSPLNERPSLLMNPHTEDEQELVFYRASLSEESGFNPIRTLRVVFKDKSDETISLIFSNGEATAFVSNKAVHLNVEYY
ncbi:hypothetical protein UJ50_001715 [Salmonella enterica subsp. enterica]|nr:hypothetical protein [Salmonella enterica subsp. enterica]